MGKFLDGIQKGKIVSPLRNNFEIKKWNDEFQKFADDESDNSIFEIGLLIFSKANEIRSNLKLIKSDKFNTTTKIRSLIGILNHNQCALKIQVKASFMQEAKKENIMMHRLAEIKIMLPSGTDYMPDEIVQSMMDGAQIPIGILLRTKPVKNENPDFSNFEWSDVSNDFNLGVLYTHIEAIWDDCLWNDFRLIKKGKRLIFCPKNQNWQINYIASQYRLDRILMQFSDIALRKLKTIVNEKNPVLNNFNSVKSIFKTGKKQTITFQKLKNYDEINLNLYIAKLYASEPYYLELLKEPQNNLCGANLENLLNAWGIVSDISIHLSNQLIESKDPDKLIYGFQDYAPIIQTEILIKAISSRLSLNLTQARSLIDFLTFNTKKTSQELWSQPLIPVSNTSISPIFSAAISPNLRRIVDVWLKQLEVDLARRGPAFENYINIMIQKEIDKSLLLKSSVILPKGMMFKPSNGREEQIDNVLIIDDLVIIGDCKCILQPTEPKGVAIHRNAIFAAVDQVKRKATSIESKKNDFVKALLDKGFKLKTPFRIFPIVIISGSIHAGLNIDGVAIVDEHIISTFFAGEIVEVALRHGDGEMQPLQKKVLYNSYEEASTYAPNYFSSPPQMKDILEGIKSRFVPVIKISESDWEAFYMTFECKVKVNPENTSFSTYNKNFQLKEDIS